MYPINSESIVDEIYFEVSPQYKWNYCEPEEDENYIPFEDYVQNYQFYIKIKIDKENFISWNEKAKEILEKIKGISSETCHKNS